MTKETRAYSKRSFLQILAVQGATLALAACGGGGDGSGGDGTGPQGGGGGGGGGGTGSLVITGTSNMPDTATAIVPDAGLPAGTSTSTAVADHNLLDAAVNSIVNSIVRTLSVPLIGNAPPALGSSYAVTRDGDNNGSPLTLLVVDAIGNKNYYFSSLSGTVKITAYSDTAVDLLFTDVTLAADNRADRNSATGQVVLNGTVTLKRV